MSGLFWGRYYFFSHHSRAFWNILSQGEAARDLFRSSGIQPHCQVSTERSGCGIMARWRPSGEQRPAMPAGEPLGLKG